MDMWKWIKCRNYIVSHVLLASRKPQHKVVNLKIGQSTLALARKVWYVTSYIYIYIYIYIYKESPHRNDFKIRDQFRDQKRGIKNCN
jgi:hypothetical protein